ncbi:MAG TPA: FAD-binding oxidoreductase [candidate division Zixibacteria bacterium]|nr:FAD-binding oxidoreductase [candidate division Zixibacteria bacterium]
MNKTADIVIIGGGIIGLSAAFQLARLNAGKIVVLEKEMFLGTGATAKCAGGIRAQFSTRINIEMSMKSEEMLVNFEKEYDYPIVYEQNGYMFLLFNDRQVAGFTKAFEMQRSLGLNVEWLDIPRINELAPPVKTDDVIKATFCQDDGIADPSDMINGYSTIARKLGVAIEIETEVTGINVEAGEVKGIVTNKGEIAAPLVINAAGPYAKVIGEMAGIDVPVEPIRRQIVTTGPLDYIPPTFPMVVDVGSGLYFHKESPGLLLGWADPDVEPGFDESVDPDYTDTIIMKALDRVPRLETAEMAKSWAGLYETTPDHHAIIDYADEVKGFFVCSGFSGHGLMHAPAAGLVAAEKIVGQDTSIDISPLSLRRFAKGKLIEETNVI